MKRFTNFSPSFLSLPLRFTLTFHGIRAPFCTYFTFMLHYNLFFCFSVALQSFELFLNFQSPVYFDPMFITFLEFFRPPCLLGPPVYMALESNLLFHLIFYIYYSSDRIHSPSDGQLFRLMMVGSRFLSRFLFYLSHLFICVPFRNTF